VRIWQPKTAKVWPRRPRESLAGEDIRRGRVEIRRRQGAFLLLVVVQGVGQIARRLGLQETAAMILLQRLPISLRVLGNVAQAKLLHQIAHQARWLLHSAPALLAALPLSSAQIFRRVLLRVLALGLLLALVHLVQVHVLVAAGPVSLHRLDAALRTGRRIQVLLVLLLHVLPQLGETRHLDLAHFAPRRRALAVLRTVLLLLILPLLVPMTTTVDEQIRGKAKLFVTHLARVHRFRGVADDRRGDYRWTSLLAIRRIVVVVVTHRALTVTRW